MKIKLLPGDHEWTTEGTHVCDELGIAKILDKELELDVDASIGSRIVPIIESSRMVRGLMPDGSVPSPPPPPEPEIEPEVEQEQPQEAPILQASKARKKKEV